MYLFKRKQEITNEGFIDSLFIGERLEYDGREARNVSETSSATKREGAGEDSPNADPSQVSS